MKFIKLSILVVIALIVIPNIAFAQSTTVTAVTPETETEADNTKSITIKVKGITCGMDLKSISTNVEKLEGVSSCTAEKAAATSAFEVKFDPALVTEKQIYSAIEDTGGCKNPADRPYKVKL